MIMVFMTPSPNAHWLMVCRRVCSEFRDNIDGSKKLRRKIIAWKRNKMYEVLRDELLAKKEERMRADRRKKKLEAATVAETSVEDQDW